MSRREKKMEKQSNKTFRKMFIVAIFLVGIIFVLKYAYNYVKSDVSNKINLVVNNNNITTSLEQDVFIDNGIVYLSKQDISNFFDSYIYYDKQYNQIMTGSETKMAYIVIGEKKMNNNGSTVNIPGTIIEKNETYYIPFSALDNIYNVKTTFIEQTNTVIVDSLDRRFVVADSNKNNSIKQERTAISRTVDRVEKGDNLVIVTDSLRGGWIKVRTDNGKLGYVKENTITNQTEIRGDFEIEKQISEDTNISMIWDYFSEYGSAPQRTAKLQGVNVVSPTFFTLENEGRGKIFENVGDSGKEYIKWAHQNGYKVWPSISNNSYINTTSVIMRDFKLRQDLINSIVSLAIKYDLDGINIDFENMYAEDKTLFNRFIIELAPRLKEYGKVLSVDVTAPDGSETWSMCYDRHTIGKVADYIVFMAYDQNTSEKLGTNAGFDWVEVNLKKFVGTQEEIDSKKVILGVPFYIRECYQESDGKIGVNHIAMKHTNEVVPSNAKKTWNDDLKQYIAEYTKNGKKYTTWLEDEKSIDAKLSLISTYNLAGAAYWQKGFEPNSIWNMIANKLNIK